MSWATRTKMALASIIFRHRVLNRWAHKQLPKTRMAAGVLLYDEDGRLLIVKPSYRHNWLVPGGIVENNESPWIAAQREVREEIGLAVSKLRLLVIDWRGSDDQYDEKSAFYLRRRSVGKTPAIIDPAAMVWRSSITALLQKRTLKTFWTPISHAGSPPAGIAIRTAPSS